MIVVLRSRNWSRQGHGGKSEETDYTVWLNDVRLRGYSTHGNMSEGYWGRDASKHAWEYAKAVATTLDTQVIRVRDKEGYKP